jgi:hypothetical protein
MNLASRKITMDVAAISDWIEIHQLVHRYAHALDDRNAAAFACLWHPGGVWSFESAEYGEHTGVEAMLAFLRGSWASGDAHHLVTNVVIDLRGDRTASGRSVAYAQTSTNGGATRFPMIATYRDEYVVHDGCWVFASRRVATDGRAAEAIERLDTRRGS